MINRKIKVIGTVQGVGFRPFIYRLAHEYQLMGSVQNLGGFVEIIVQGEIDNINKFIEDIIKKAPPLAKPVIAHQEDIFLEKLNHFQIIESKNTVNSNISVPADYFTCDDCLQELLDPNNPRYLYPFINCTHCGPRYSIIKSLPYDRKNTTMENFTLCSNCLQEYQNPLDRRFHAEPIACPKCGPKISFYDNKQVITENILEIAIDYLKNGKILAVKGIGGYHLLCDANNDDAVQNLRIRKKRPDKPLAIIVDNIEINNKYLNDNIRPIVLINKKHINFPFSEHIAPYLNEIGIMRAYSPLHYLLLKQFKKPLVATSGNISGEPVIIDNQEARDKLNTIVDGFLEHNREILRPVDDSVVRIIHNKANWIRLGRGISPLEMTLDYSIEKPILALGGHTKNTIALGFDNRIIVSQHIGDMAGKKSIQLFHQLIEDLKNLYQIQPEVITYDANPSFYSHQWAENQENIEKIKVYHHHAHASHIAGEYPEVNQWLVFTYDGIGYGENHTLWGGEAFLGKAGDWQRVASIREFTLTGGDDAARAPWRSACALCWELNIDYFPEIPYINIAHQAFRKKINTFKTSAMGRLFDGAAYLLQLIKKTSFEGQAPMLLEAKAYKTNQCIKADFYQKDNILYYNWEKLIYYLLNQNNIAEAASVFHTSIAQMMLEKAFILKEKYGEFTIGLSGGVFQNALLTEMVIELFLQHDFKIYTANKIPCNDAGLSFGQTMHIVF